MFHLVMRPKFQRNTKVKSWFEWRMKDMNLGQFLEKGYDSYMKYSSFSISVKKYNLITKVPMSRNSMFLLNIQNDVAKYFKACYSDASWLQYLRFGHFNFKGLSLLSKNKMSFPKESIWRVKKPFELIYADVCGPIKLNWVEVIIFSFSLIIFHENNRFISRSKK